MADKRDAAGKEVTVLLPFALHKKLKIYACRQERPLKGMLAHVVREFLSQSARERERE